MTNRKLIKILLGKAQHKKIVIYSKETVDDYMVTLGTILSVVETPESIILEV